MKNLNFVLKNNGNVLFDENIEYEENEHYIYFDLNKTKFKFSLFSKLHFIKETEEDIFEIKMVSDEVQALYTLKSHNITFDVKILDFEYSFCDNIYNIKYNIESDPNSVKEIILTLG